MSIITEAVLEMSKATWVLEYIKEHHGELLQEALDAYDDTMRVGNVGGNDESN